MGKHLQSVPAASLRAGPNGTLACCQTGLTGVQGIMVGQPNLCIRSLLGLRFQDSTTSSVYPGEREYSEYLAAGQRAAGGALLSLGRVFLPVAEQAPSRVPISHGHAAWPRLCLQGQHQHCYSSIFNCLLNKIDIVE